jgi:formiminotetrahydrofolate cyclodeaminase
MFLGGGSSSSIVMCLMMALMAAVMQMNVADAFIRQKNQYTPLLFFKVPAGTMDECKYL